METNEAKIRHLEMIQGVISRMAANSFMLKGWAVTLVAGFFALADKNSERLFFLLAYLPIILFWFLDTYYLQLEKRYRLLFEQERVMKEADVSFTLTAPAPLDKDGTRYFQCFLSKTELWFYFPSAILIAIIICII